MKKEYDFDTPATPDQVFQHVGYGFFENHSRWDPMVVGMTQHSNGPIRVGTTGEETRAFAGRRMSNDVRVTVFDPSRQFGFEATSGAVRERLLCTITPKGTGSHVDIELVFTPAAAAMRLAWPLMRRIIARNVERNQPRLQHAVDAEATEPARGG